MSKETCVCTQNSRMYNKRNLVLKAGLCEVSAYIQMKLTFVKRDLCVHTKEPHVYQKKPRSEGEFALGGCVYTKETLIYQKTPTHTRTKKTYIYEKR